MKRKIPFLVACVALSVLLSALPACAQVWFDGSFDNEPADAGNPNGFFVFGAGLAYRGVTSSQSVSPSQSAEIIVDFDVGFVGMISDPRNTIMLSNLSVQVRADTDLSGNLGLFGFQIIDTDGTTARTETGDLFSPSTTFQTFSQDATNVTLQTAPGTIPGLNVNAVAQVSVLFLDRNDISGTVTFHVDDFTAIGTVIPEPSTGGLMLVGLVFLRGRGRRHVARRLGLQQSRRRSCV